MPATVTAVIVSYADPEATRHAVATIRDQVDEVIVVDNHEASLFGDGADVLRLGGNVGYTAACNAAAQRATGEWVLFLNPDAVAATDAVAQLVSAGAASDVGIVGAQILLPNGTVNAGANPLHVAGLSWSGGYGEAREHGPSRDVASVSGAALMVRRFVFERLGGMCPVFFLYGDDADLCWRARLAGWRVVYCPKATVVHDYEFEGGSQKWFWLERNRLWSVLSNYSMRTLFILAPVLTVTELGTLLVALRGGWAREKMRAWRELWISRAERRAWRARVQATRRVADRVLVDQCTARFETPLLSNPLLPLVNPLIAAYVRGARRVL